MSRTNSLLSGNAIHSLFSFLYKNKKNKKYNLVCVGHSVTK